MATVNEDNWFTSNGTSELPSVGEQVSQIRIDFAVGLLFEDEALLRIETPFEVFEPTSQKTLVDRTSGDSCLGPTLGLFGRTLRKGDVYENGDLRLEFNDSSTLLVRSDSRYEAWTYARRNGETVVAIPGGGLAYFGPSVPLK